MRPWHWFAYPWLLWALAPLPLLGLMALWNRGRRRRALARLGTRVALLDGAARPRGFRLMRGLNVALGLALLGLGIAGPQWGKDWDQSAAPGRDLMVVVDCSRSMLAETPSRLDHARAALLDLAQALQKRGGHRVGLVVFAGKARLLCPLTHDYDHFRSTLDNLEAAPFDPELEPDGQEESGTRIGLGLHEAIKAHDPRCAGARDILLLSDGDDPARDGEYRLGADEARDLGIPVLVIGLGDPDVASPIRIAGKTLVYEGQEVRSRLEEAPLRDIAQRTHGVYTSARTRSLPLGAALSRPGRRPGSARAKRRCHSGVSPALRTVPGAGVRTAAPDHAAAGTVNLVPEARRAPAMKRRLSVPLLFVLIGVLLAAAPPPPDVEALLREGNVKFQLRDYAAAIALYEKAESISTDPGQVAFNLAVAHYAWPRPTPSSGRVGCVRRMPCFAAVWTPRTRVSRGRCTASGCACSTTPPAART